MRRGVESERGRNKVQSCTYQSAYCLEGLGDK